MKLVEFSNGKWGIRTYWWFGWHFLDFDDNTTSRRQSSVYFRYCQTSRGIAEARFADRMLKHRVVKVPQGGLEEML